MASTNKKDDIPVGGESSALTSWRGSFPSSDGEERSSLPLGLSLVALVPGLVAAVCWWQQWAAPLLAGLLPSVPTAWCSCCGLVALCSSCLRGWCKRLCFWYHGFLSEVGKGGRGPDLSPPSQAGPSAQSFRLLGGMGRVMPAEFTGQGDTPALPAEHQTLS